VYHDVAQWTMVRRKVLDKGHSRRQVAKETGLSRKTIRKMLLHELPQPYKRRTPRHPALQQYTAMLDAFASLSVTPTPTPQVSISEIYRCLKREEGYSRELRCRSGLSKVSVHCTPSVDPKVLGTTLRRNRLHFKKRRD
jgi:hypothetical protein